MLLIIFIYLVVNGNTVFCFIPTKEEKSEGQYNKGKNVEPSDGSESTEENVRIEVICNDTVLLFGAFWDVFFLVLC